MTSMVLSGGEASEPFDITNGVKQGGGGGGLAPVLFNLFFICVLSYAVRDIEDGVYIRYRMDGSLFDLRRLSVKTKTIEKLILEALFADDCALMAHTESTLQLIFNKFAEESRLFGLTISLGKTEVLFQSSPLIPEDDLQRLTDYLFAATKHFGLTISIKMTAFKGLNSKHA
ncbi:hypothetical protein ACOMHN_007017 [Nucella lapillus]